MDIYKYYLLILTILVIYEIIFSVLVRPYYVKKLMNEDMGKVHLPEVSMEAFIFLTIVLGLAFSNSFKVHPFLFLGPIFLIYGVASFNHKFNFYLASALLFNVHRGLSYENQMKYQQLTISVIFFVLSITFFAASFLYKIQPPGF